MAWLNVRLDDEGRWLVEARSGSISEVARGAD